MEVVTIPTLPKPVTLSEPPPPSLRLPPVIVMTPDDAAYFAEACEAFESVGQPGGSTPGDIVNDYPGLTRENACRWAIYGFTVQDWLTIESQMAEIAGYVEQLRAQIRFLKELMDERQRIIDERNEALDKAGRKAQTVGYD